MDNATDEKESGKAQGFAWANDVDTLYKFKGFRGDQRCHVEDMLENSRVFFASPSDFNDPLDCAPVIVHGGDPNNPAYLAELEGQELEIMREQGMSDAEIVEFRRANGTDAASLPDQAMRRLRDDLRGVTRIFCLSAEQRHPLQWSHYGDKHQGVCVHFRSDRSSNFGRSQKVHYQPNRTPIQLPLTRQSNDEIMNLLTLVKADFWTYEHEYRSIWMPGVAGWLSVRDHYPEIPPDVISGITIGHCMNEPDRIALFKMLDEHRPDLPVWRAREDHSRFWMYIEQVR